MGGDRTVRDAYDRLAPEYDGRWARYIEASVEETLRRARLHPDDRVLDVGCGTGVLLQALARAGEGRRLVGADLSVGMLRAAGRRLPPEVALTAAAVGRLPFRSGSLDAVVSSSSLHYWRVPAEGLGEIRRVLRPGGTLLLTDWCRDFWTVRALDRLLRLVDRAHHRTYPVADLRRMLERAGFRVRDVGRYRIDWLWGLMTARAEVPAG